MRGWMIAAAGLWLAPVQAFAAEGVVIWLEPQVPSEKAQEKALKRTGATKHVAHAQLAFPAQPVTDADAKAYLDLRKALADARARWEDFDVERGIASDLETAFSAITVIRDERDQDQLVQSLAWQGAAVFRGFEEEDFKNGVQAEPYRWVVESSGAVYNRPWMSAMAIDADRHVDQADAEAATWADLQRFQSEAGALTAGSVDASGVPSGVSVVIDGKVVDLSSTVTLAPGDHWIHGVVDGVVGGRDKFDVQPGQKIEVPMLVSSAELAKARELVAQGSAAGMPADVKTAIEKLAEVQDGPIFLAVEMDGKVKVLPFTNGAALVDQKPVTVLVGADIGPSLSVSNLFDHDDGNLVTAPGMSGSLSVETGIYNAAIVLGADLSITPGNSVTFGDADGDSNSSISAFPQPFAAIGGYPIRPLGHGPYLLIAASYGWNAPAHLAPGGRIVLGIPAGKKPDSYIRVSLGGSASPKSMWDEGETKTPLYTMFLRVGLGGLL